MAVNADCSSGALIRAVVLLIDRSPLNTAYLEVSHRLFEFAMTGPERPPSSSRERPRSGWMATIVVGLFLLGGGALLCLLPIGKLGPAIVLGGGLFTLMVGLHYLIWGYWIQRVIQQDQESQDEM